MRAIYKSVYCFHGPTDGDLAPIAVGDVPFWLYDGCLCEHVSRDVRRPFNRHSEARAMKQASPRRQRAYDRWTRLRARPLTILIIVGTFVFFVLTGIELMTTSEPLSLVDVTMELVENSLLAGAMVVMAAIASETRILRRQHRLLTDKVSEVAADSEKWRQAAQDVVADLNRAIDSQFSEWGLSEAERGVALLMLKGFSHKEIARLRSSTSATVRQQASAIYEKSSLPNRSEFVAFFLDAMLAPADARQLQVSPDIVADHALQK
tara:strand:- start:2333 stop:3124 length:792 start_codon:yes stop_codon:yes gene_type:complete